jgi:hypothetical protein
MRIRLERLRLIHREIPRQRSFLLPPSSMTPFLEALKCELLRTT